MKNNGLSQRRRGRRENHVAFVAVHWGDCSNARHAIPPDVDVLKTSGGKKRSLSVLCVLKRSGREMLVTLWIIYNHYRALYEKSLQTLKRLTDSSTEGQKAAPEMKTTLKQFLTEYKLFGLSGGTGQGAKWRKR